MPKFPFRFLFGNLVGKAIGILVVGVFASWVIDSYIHSSLAHVDSDGGDGGALLVGLILIAIGVVIYFIPTIVASSRAHPDKTAIFVLNFLLGWLLIPWVIALVWAYKEKAVVTIASSDLGGFSHKDVAVLHNQKSEYRKCPFCAEEVKREAIKCKHCGSEIKSLPPVMSDGYVDGDNN